MTPIDPSRVADLTEREPENDLARSVEAFDAFATAVTV